MGESKYQAFHVIYVSPPIIAIMYETVHSYRISFFVCPTRVLAEQQFRDIKNNTELRVKLCVGQEQGRTKDEVKREELRPTPYVCPFTSIEEAQQYS